MDRIKKHIMLVDTREQRPLKNFGAGICTKRATLQCGDYCMVFQDGARSSTEFERKSLADLFGTVTQGHARFRQKLLRARKSKIRLILIIECTLRDAYKGVRHSKAQPRAIVKAVFSLWVKYRVFPVFCSDRDEMAEYMRQYYMAEWRKREADHA